MPNFRFSKWVGPYSTNDDMLCTMVANRWLRVIYYLLKRIPEDRRPTYNCHVIHRALAHLISPLDGEVRVVDGLVMGFTRNDEGKSYKMVAMPHAWLVLPSGNIIDAYPCGFVVENEAVLIITKGPYAPLLASHYREDKEEALKTFNMRDTYRAVNVIRRLFREELRKNPKLFKGARRLEDWI